MRIVVIGSRALVLALADLLHAHAADRVLLDLPDSFVLDGKDLRVTGARALDTLLRTRAAQVDAVLWVGGGDHEVLRHYEGRIVDLTAEDDPYEAALAGLRELLFAAP